MNVIPLVGVPVGTVRRVGSWTVASRRCAELYRVGGTLRTGS